MTPRAHHDRAMHICDAADAAMLAGDRATAADWYAPSGRARPPPPGRAVPGGTVPNLPRTALLRLLTTVQRALHPLTRPSRWQGPEGPAARAAAAHEAVGLLLAAAAGGGPVWGAVMRCVWEAGRLYEASRRDRQG